MLIRDATAEDLPAICALFNALIPTTTIAWRDEVSTLDEQRAWFAEQRRRGHPVMVADDDGEVIGYCCWSGFRGGERFPGYRHTVEHTLHVREDVRRRGAGRLLLTALVDRARQHRVHVMVAAIDSTNETSIAFHAAMGFVEVARMPETGRKFDRWLELVLMQRIV